jgi:hypothetical protein
MSTVEKSQYQKEREERDRLAALAHDREMLHDLSDVADPVGGGVGLHLGQYTRVTLHGKKEHGTTGAVHVALDESGGLVVAVEHAPGKPFELRRTIRRGFWRFYDFWRFDEDKRDNFLRPEDEWPEVEEYVKVGRQWLPKSEVEAALRGAEQ